MAMNELVRPYDVELRATSKFLAKRLRNEARALGKVCEAPELRATLGHDAGRACLVRWLGKEHPEGLALLRFVDAVEYYRTTAAPRLRKTRAAQIVDKHLEAAAAGTPDPAAFRKTAASRQEALAASTAPPKREIFDELETMAMAALEALFRGGFEASPAFVALRRDHRILETRAQAAERAAAGGAVAGDLDDSDDDDDVDDDDDAATRSTAV